MCFVVLAPMETRDQMTRLEYGNTGLVVSRLCFGAAHLANACASYAEGGKLLLAAFDRGVTFWDTAEAYGTQPHVGAALEGADRSQVVIQTKTPAKTDVEARTSIERSLKEMDTDDIDIYLLHGVGSVEDLEARAGALSALVDAKHAGTVRAVGCSIHVLTEPLTDAVLVRPELQCVLTIANKGGAVLDGAPLDRQLKCMRRIYESGRGVSLMKVIGAGRIPESDIEDWMRWGFDVKTAHVVNLGMTSNAHIDTAIRIAEG